MYTWSIILFSIGIISLILNSYLFFQDYKWSLSKKLKQKIKILFFSVNWLVLMSGLASIILGVVSIFLISNQLS